MSGRRAKLSHYVGRDMKLEVDGGYKLYGTVTTDSDRSGVHYSFVPLIDGRPIPITVNGVNNRAILPMNGPKDTIKLVNRPRRSVGRIVA